MRTASGGCKEEEGGGPHLIVTKYFSHSAHEVSTVNAIALLTAHKEYSVHCC